MINKVLAYINEHHMLQPGDGVVAGISGGADSVCLLFVLLKIREIIPFELSVVHVNHKIRKEAGEDAAFVKNLCEKWGCEYRYTEADVESFALKEHISTEEAGRMIRYEAFERVCRETGAEKIAVAHNQNDNAETILFHLMRGTGLRGLTGIRPVRERIIRPLLCVNRKEIENFLQNQGISYCIDKTNDEDTYTRNRIRHHILPYAEEEICKQAVSHICDTGVMISEAEQYIHIRTEEALERCVAVSGASEMVLKVALFCAEDVFIQKQLALLIMERLVGSRKDIGAVHVKALCALFFRESNGQCDLPYGLTAYREYDSVRIVASQKEGRQSVKRTALEKKQVLIPGETGWTEELCVRCRLFPYEKNGIIPQKTYTKWFDYDKIVKPLVLRTRQTGDYLEIRQDGGHKSLKSYLIDEKIPKEKRDELLLLADDSHILWVVGMRISERYKINENTKTVLEIQVIGGTSDGGED